MIQFLSYHRQLSGIFGTQFLALWWNAGNGHIHVWYLLTGTDGPKSAHTKHAAQCQVSVHKTRGANTHTHTHIHNKSQGILSKRSAEPGQTEGDGQAQGQSQWGSFRHSSSHPFTVIQPLPWLRSPPQEVFVAHISELLVGHYSPLMPRPIVLQNICWSLSNIVDVIIAAAAGYDHISLMGWWR